MLRPGIRLPASPIPIPAAIAGDDGSKNFTLTGQAVDATGAGYVGATVKLFRSGDDSLVATTTADGSGNFVFTIPSNAGKFWVAAFDTAGNPAGASVRTLVAV